MAAQQHIHIGVLQADLLLSLDPGQITRRRLAPDLAIGLVGNRRLVEDTVVLIFADALLLAPVPREDVVNIERDLVWRLLLLGAFD